MSTAVRRTSTALRCCFLLVALVALVGPRADGSSTEELQRSIHELGAKTFRERESAQRRLLEAGEQDYQAVLSQCLRAYSIAKDPEVRVRVREIMAALVDKFIFNRPRGFLGVALHPAAAIVDGEKRAGAISVQNVIADSAAQRAGVQIGDQILHVDNLGLPPDAPVGTFITYIQSKRPGDKVTLTIKKDAGVQAVDVQLGDMPEDVRARTYNQQRKEEFFENWLRTQLDSAESGGAR